MVGHGGSSANLYLADPTSSINSNCAVIILFKSVPVHELLQLALLELTYCSTSSCIVIKMQSYLVPQYNKIKFRVMLLF